MARHGPGGASAQWTDASGTLVNARANKIDGWHVTRGNPHLGYDAGISAKGVHAGNYEKAMTTAKQVLAGKPNPEVTEQATYLIAVSSKNSRVPMKPDLLSSAYQWPMPRVRWFPCLARLGAGIFRWRKAKV